MSKSYQPETDGSSERSNKTMIESLRQYVNLRQSDWADHLIHVEAAMNNSVNATTGKTPTEMVYGLPSDCFPRPKISLNQTSIYEPYQIIFSGFKTISPSPETVTLRPRRNKPLMQIRNDRRSQITRMETRFIWRPRMYGTDQEEGQKCKVPPMLCRSGR